MTLSRHPREQIKNPIGNTTTLNIFGFTKISTLDLQKQREDLQAYYPKEILTKEYFLEKKNNFLLRLIDPVFTDEENYDENKTLIDFVKQQPELLQELKKYNNLGKMISPCFQLLKGGQTASIQDIIKKSIETLEGIRSNEKQEFPKALLQDLSTMKRCGLAEDRMVTADTFFDDKGLYEQLYNMLRKKLMVTLTKKSLTDLLYQLYLHVLSETKEENKGRENIEEFIRDKYFS